VIKDMDYLHAKKNGVSRAVENLRGYRP